MNTPITDAAQTITMDCDDSCLPIYVYESGTIYEGELVPAFVARRLELDRSALMEAVADIDPYPDEEIGNKVHDGAVYCEISVGDMRSIRSALAAARANFPES